jgi:hypothetical protein
MMAWREKGRGQEEVRGKSSNLFTHWGHVVALAHFPFRSNLLPFL